MASLVERCIVPVKQEYLCAPGKARVAVPPLPRELEADASHLNKSKTQKKRVSSHLLHMLVLLLSCCGGIVLVVFTLSSFPEACKVHLAVRLPRCFSLATLVPLCPCDHVL